MTGNGLTEDNRRSTRRRTLLAAQLTLRPDEQPLSAIIRNISQHGALLQLEMIQALPQHLQLSIPKLQVNSRVRVVWKRGREVGVEFAESVAEAASAPSEVELLRARITTLEATVQALKGRIRELSGQD